VWHHAHNLLMQVSVNNSRSYLTKLWKESVLLYSSQMHVEVNNSRYQLENNMKGRFYILVLFTVKDGYNNRFHTQTLCVIFIYSFYQLLDPIS